MISCPFSSLTLNSYDGGSTYSGTVYDQQGTYTSDWTISPQASTSSQGTTRTFTPSSDHTTGSFTVQIYAEIKSGVLTFIFNPSTTLLNSQISTSYTYSTNSQPAGSATPYTINETPTKDAYNTLSSYATTEGSSVTVPKSSNPLQTQTISFSGSYSTQHGGTQSFDWTGTISLDTGNQVIETVTPTPDSNQNQDDGTTGEIDPTPTATPSSTINVPQPETGGAKISNIRGNIQITRASSDTPQAVTGETTLNLGDRIKAEANSWVTITYSDGSKFDLAPGCEITIEDRQDNNQYKNIALLKGLIHLWEQVQADGRKFKVHAIAFAMAIRGSELTIDANDTGVTVTVIEGTVDVKNLQTGDTVTLEAGQSLSATNDMSRQQMQQSIQPTDVSTINRWWNQVYQGSFNGLTIAIIASVAIIAVIAVVLVVLMIRRRKSGLPPPPPPPPPP